MPQTVATVDVLQQYIRGVIDRAEHHANHVDEVCLAIAGAIVWRKDDDLLIMTREGEMKNVLWMHVNGRRYALSYNHSLQCIQVREGTVRGDALASFTNATPIGEVKRFFGSL